ncbi:MAG TPA: DNA repair protein RecO, partial [Anaerolineales bacterium]|nr:DNA repair protein RecO [Anaerolineales bacterium]
LEMGEADRLLTLFTREQGKLRAIAKGVRKIRSRKSGHLQPFTRSSLQLARGRDMMIVTQAETLDAYLPLHQDWVLTSYAAYVVELLDRFTFEEGENQALYRLLVETLQRLSAGDMPEQVVRYYELRLLDLVGFRPQLFQCVRCNRAVQPEDQFFSAELGGALCPQCGPAAPGARPVTLQTLKYLRHFQRSPYQEAARAPLPPTLNREMETLMQHYLTHLLERGLNTPPFLRRARSSRLDIADAQPPDASTET